MKRIWMFLWLPLLLWGCGAGETPVWETVTDTLDAPASAQTPYAISANAPVEAPAVEAFAGDGRQVYAQEDGLYQLTAETCTAESLDALLLELTGFQMERLPVIKTWENGMPRYDCTWTCVGETGMEVCRAAVLDDGTYYYVLTSSVPADKTAQCEKQIQQYFLSFGLHGGEGV